MSACLLLLTPAWPGHGMQGDAAQPVPAAPWSQIRLICWVPPQGQAMLCEAMRATRDLEIRENIVQLLWDLEAGQSAECHFEPGGCMIDCLVRSSGVFVWLLQGTVWSSRGPQLMGGRPSSTHLPIRCLQTTSWRC